MSVENVKKFFSNEAVANEGIKEKVIALGKPGDKEYAGKLVAIAQSEGFDFTIEDLIKAHNETYKEELTDEQLEAVAGGTDVGAVVFVATDTDGNGMACVLVGFG